MTSLRCAVLCAVLSYVVGFGALCGSDGRHLNITRGLRASVPTPNLKVAFLGDQGTGSNPAAVLRMIRQWIGNSVGNAMIVHSGDFDYISSANTWMNAINAIIDLEIPYFVSIGNHDVAAWTNYQRVVVDRYAASGVTSACEGETATNQWCVYNGLHFVLSGVGTRGSGHAAFVNSVFSQNPAVWKFVSWHKNQRIYQVGGKNDETGYEIYDMSRTHGAFIVTGHEHSYCRTKNMAQFSTPRVADNSATMTTKPGQTFAFVSGLGGVDIRAYDTRGTTAYPGPLKDNVWWAQTAASNDGVGYGALLCTFNINNNPNSARCQQLDTAGRIWDEFTIVSQNSATVPSSPAASDCSVPQWLEIPITNGENDVTAFESGAILSSSTQLPLSRQGNVSTVRLTFQGIDLSRESRIRNAYLQVYGASPSNADLTADIVIQAREQGPQVSWTTSDDEFEHHEIWVTPDLTALLNDAIARHDWQGTVTLSLTGRGNTTRSVYSFDHSPCVSPTLTVQLEPRC